MNLRECIGFIEQHEKELTLINVDTTDPIREELPVYFDTQNVRITTEQTASGAPANIAILSDQTNVLAIVDIALLRELISSVPTKSDGVGIADTEYKTILDHLKETTFTSHDSQQLLHASREIEDRARRLSSGTLHAGFQRFSLMANQQSIYTDLACRGVNVHAYGVPDISPPDFGSGSIHAIETDEIAETWFVVFDGGCNDAQKTALLAEERDDDAFYGAWTYDPGIVDHILTYIHQTYDSSADSARTSSRN